MVKNPVLASVIIPGPVFATCGKVSRKDQPITPNPYLINLQILNKMRQIDLNQFVNSYLATAAWVTCEGDECTDFTREAKKQAKNDCQQFIDKVLAKFGENKGVELLTIPGNDLTYLTPHNFFLTRNHHGAGFWDSGNIYGEGEALDLTELSHQMKEVNCYHIRGKKSKLTFD